GELFYTKYIDLRAFGFCGHQRRGRHAESIRADIVERLSRTAGGEKGQRILRLVRRAARLHRLQGARPPSPFRQERTEGARHLRLPHPGVGPGDEESLQASSV